MNKEIEFGITIDRCPQCDGTWFDTGELELFIKRRAEDEAIPPKTAESSPEPTEVAKYQMTQTDINYRKCPRCEELMLRKTYQKISGVMSDVCHPHGIFLDSGECRKIQAFIASGGHKLAKQYEEEEKKRLENWRKRSLALTKSKGGPRRTKVPGIIHNLYGYEEEMAQLGDALSVVFDLFTSTFTD